MKLLLTSGGLRNATLTQALLDLADKPASELKVAFIPTAMNTEPGDKGWAIAQMVRLQEIGVSQIDIYALDDQMAAKVDGEKVEFVGEGEHVTFESKRDKAL